MLAMQFRPDLRAAQQGVTAARSQESLTRANGKKDLNVSFNYSHGAEHQFRSFLLQYAIPGFRSQSGRNRPHAAAITQAAGARRGSQ